MIGRNCTDPGYVRRDNAQFDPTGLLANLKNETVNKEKMRINTREKKNVNHLTRREIII